MSKYAHVYQSAKAGLLLGLLFASSVFALGGDKDLGFGDKGIVRSTKTGPTADRANTLLTSIDGKIVLLGNSTGSNHFAMARYSLDGKLDTSFSDDGKTDLNIGGVAAGGVYIGSNIVVAGSGGIVRILPTGELDKSFGVNGKVALPNDSSGCRLIPEAIIASADGGFVIAGTGCYFDVAKFNADGSLNSSFGDNNSGVTQLTAINHPNSVFDFVAQISVREAENGKLVLATSHTVTGTIDTAQFALTRLNSNGSLDTTFNGNGSNFYSPGPNGSYATDLVIQADGKIVVSGMTNLVTDALSEQFVIARFNADGALDTSFNGNGSQLIQVRTSTSFVREQASALTLDGNKIIATGYSINPASGFKDTAVVRLNADGSLDNSFSKDGKAVIYVGTEGDAGLAVTALSGKVLIGGYAQTLGATEDFSLIRLSSNGSLDLTFAHNGKAGAMFFGSAINSWLGMAVQSDEKILAVNGFFDGRTIEMLMARYNPDGTPDTAFGVNGYSSNKVDDAGGYLRTVQVQADGKILACGDIAPTPSKPAKVLLARFNSDGSLDTTFSNIGYAKLDTSKWVPKAAPACRRIAVQSNGKIVLALQDFGPALVGMVARFKPDGSLDTGFANNGVFVYPNNTTNLARSSANGIAILSTGKILVGGRYSERAPGAITRTYSFLAFRLTATGTLDTTFNGNGSVITAMEAGAYGRDLALLAGDKFIIGGFDTLGFEAVRYNADGSLDSSFGTAGRFTGPVPGNSNSVASDWDFAVAGNGKLTFIGQQDQYDASGNALNTDMLWLRATSAGAIDTSFTANGVKQLSFNTSATDDTLLAIAMQTDGKILSGGNCGGVACVIRLKGDAASSFSDEPEERIESMPNTNPVLHAPRKSEHWRFR